MSEPSLVMECAPRGLQPQPCSSDELPAEELLPLSSIQRRLWFLDRLEPGSALYNAPVRIWLRGGLEPRALEWALNGVVQRHEILRTVYRTRQDGYPLQFIRAAQPLHVEHVSLADQLKAQRQATAIRLSSQSAVGPFDLSCGPVLRAQLVELEPELHLLTLTLHHIAGDGWSLGVLCRELAALYAEQALGQPAHLPELPVQYADYALWQQDWLASEEAQRSLRYWKEKLAGAPGLVELPTDRPRPAIQTYRGDIQQHRLPAGLRTALLALARQEQASPFMVLLAGFQALLHRYTGAVDIAVGSPIANRNRPETEALIGCFLNTLVLRTRFEVGLSFRALVRRVRETALDAFNYQDVPFEELVEALHPGRDLSTSPLFNVFFVFQNFHFASAKAGALEFRPEQAWTETAKFDLTLFVAEAGNELELTAEYNRDLFDAPTIARLLKHLECLLASAVADPEQSVDLLSLLTSQERDQLVVRWNATDSPYPAQATLHQLVEKQTEQTPAAIAVQAEQGRLSYENLNRRANQLAHYLRLFGVGPEVVVGLCLERSLELVVSLLAILKAGGAYVPLDPAYPPGRLGGIMRESRARVLVTRSTLVDHCCPTEVRDKLKVVCLDRCQDAIEQQPVANPEPLAGPFNLAYVLYTSGSTGHPKGVEIEHHSPVALVAWAQALYSAEELSGVLFATSVCFDLSIFELFVPLGSGGTVILADNSLQLPVLAAASQVSLINTVPSAITELLRLKGIPTSVRTINLAGEPLPAELVERLYRQTSVQKVYDLYGPTEDTTYSTCAGRHPGDPANIGRPLPNKRAYILDAQKLPCPVGVPGELHLAGVGLARGYRHRPDLTAERFIPNSFSSEPAARLYRTGDLAKFRSDGCIEYLGRLDHQVKLRGFRIELGEIENVLAGHPAVKEVVVVAREDEPGEKRLVAYWVAQPGQSGQVPAAAELRDFLRRVLPEFMLPAAFVNLAALPRTQNGKVDRKVLPKPDMARLVSGDTYAAPRSVAEQALAVIWQDLLHLPRVGISDNFFTLGGDSILGIQVIARARTAGLCLTPKQVFQHQTIAELAAAASPVTGAVEEAVPLTSTVPLTPIQRWFFEQSFFGPSHWNQALEFELKARLEPGLLKETVGALLRHHEALRLRFAKTPQGWEQRYEAADHSIPFEQFDFSGDSEAEQAAAKAECIGRLQASLALETGPLLRVAYFDLGPSRPGRIFMAIHHLAVDGVSWRILFEDFEQAYHQLRTGKTVQLPKTASFQSWAQRLLQEAQSPEMQEEIPYWLTLPTAALPLVPADAPTGGPNTEGSAETVVRALSRQETSALLQQVPPVYNTQINDVLLTALTRVFTQSHQRDSLLFYLEGHGREIPGPALDVSRTVGWFTSLFPVCLKLPAGLDCGLALKSVKEQLRRIPHNGVGYGMLRYLAKDAALRRELARLAPPELVFNYLGQFDQTFSNGALLRFAAAATGSARHPQAHRCTPLEINAGVFEGVLQVAWTYSRNLHQHETIERYADRYLAGLRELIAHCLSTEAGGRTPSDFALADISQDELDGLYRELEEKA